MNAAADIIEGLRAGGLDDYQIVEVLDEARTSLSLITPYELRAQIRVFQPGFHIQTIYSMHERHPDQLPGRKINEVWYYERAAALCWVAKLKAKAARRKQRASR